MEYRLARGLDRSGHLFRFSEATVNKKALYNNNFVVKYLSVFGSANPRISGLYKEWKGAGVV